MSSTGTILSDCTEVYNILNQVRNWAPSFLAKLQKYPATEIPLKILLPHSRSRRNLHNKLYIKTTNIYMLFAGWEGRIVKNCDRGLENAARGSRPRAAFSSPRSQFFTIRTDPKPANIFFLRQIGFHSGLRNFVTELASVPSTNHRKRI